MIFSALLLSIVVPVSISPDRSTEFIAKPYIVQAVIDSGRIAGLPPSKAAKAYAAKIQTPDPVLQQISYTPEPMPSRKLFFKNYFSTGGT
jgi:hypothetical protein